MDLGYKPEPVEPPATEGPSEPETRYPSLSLEDGSVDLLKGEHQCAVGDEYVADGVRLRVKEVSDTEYGKKLSFDVLSVDDFEPADGGEDDAVETDDSMTADAEPAKKTPKALRYS
jgi:hypothetical protein